MKQILEYLLSLNPEVRDLIMNRMLHKANGTSVSPDGGCAGKQPIGPGDTPNGSWECIDGAWKWIPDLG